MYFLQCARDLPGTAQTAKNGVSSSEMDYNSKVEVVFSLHHNSQLSVKNSPRYTITHSELNVLSDIQVRGNVMFQLPYKTLMMIVYAGPL